MSRSTSRRLPWQRREVDFFALGVIFASGAVVAATVLSVAGIAAAVVLRKSQPMG